MNKTAFGDRQLPELPRNGLRSRSWRKRPKSSLNLLIPFTGNKHRFQMNFNNWNLFWSLCFGLLSFLIIVGNALSISILFKRRLRKRPHFLLISLAFADLLVGLIPMPLYIMNQANSLLHTAYWVYLCVDMITGLSSVFTLTAISLERLHAISSTTHLTQLCDCHSNPMDLLPYCVVILFAVSFFCYNQPSVLFGDNY